MPLNPRAPALVKLRRDSGKLEVTLPRRLLRAVGWRQGGYVALTLTDDGAGLVIEPVTSL